MDTKLVKKEEKLEELKKMKKRKLKDLSQSLMSERATVANDYREIEKAYRAMTKKLIAAKDEEDSAKVERITSKMAIYEKELNRLEKREKSLTEELDLVHRALKNDFDGQSSAWTTVGAWIIGGATVFLSGWGISKSHESFDKGTMVDKGTRGLAERLSGLLNYITFQRK